MRVPGPAPLLLVLAALWAPARAERLPGTPEAVAARVYVVAKFTARDGDDRRAEAVFRAHAEASRRDAGNGSFTVVQDRTAPGQFTTLEIWRDEAAMKSHQGTAHYKAFHDAIGPLLAVPPDVRLNRLMR